MANIKEFSNDQIPSIFLTRLLPKLLLISIACTLSGISHAEISTADNNSQPSLLTLKANPQLFQEHINTLIKSKNLTRLQTVLPHYNELTNKDSLVINNADRLLKSEGNSITAGTDVILHANNKTNASDLPQPIQAHTNTQYNKDVYNNEKQNLNNNEPALTEQLLTNPQEFTIYINALVAQKNIPVLKQLLPKYKTLDNHDPFLVEYAEATIYTFAREYKSATEIYKKMLAADPSLTPVRVKLADTLFKDKQYTNAQQQFIKLKGEDLPKSVMTHVEKSLATIDRLADWKYSLSMRPLYNNNINDAPTKRMVSGFGATAEPITAYGMRVNASIDKKFNLSNNLYTSVTSNLDSDVYFKESTYNEYTLSLLNSWGYADAKSSIAATPFVNKRFLDNEALNTHYGIKVNGSKWVKPKLQLSANTQYNQTRFDSNKEKNRNSEGYLGGLSGLYIQNARQYFYGGISHYNNKVDKSIILNYQRNSMYAGWSREWPQGISSSLTASYAKKQYANPTDDKSFAALPYYATFGGAVGSARTDTTKSLSAQLWKRDLTLWGLTPKLAMSYSKIDSNFSYYDNRGGLNGTVIINKNF